MRGQFEESLRSTAVDAVERRWAAEENARRRISRARLRSLAIRVALLVTSLVVVGIFAARHFGIEIPLPFSGGVTWRAPWTGLTDAERGHVNSFMDAIKLFGEGDIIPWKDAPQNIRLKQAPQGCTYLSLVERRGGICGLYEMVADGKGHLSITELSPMSRPVKVTLADFKRERVGSVYLISCDGRVYVCGTDDPEEGIAFARRMGVYGLK